VADTLLRNGLVDVGGGEFRTADVLVASGRIASIGDSADSVGAEVVDCSRFAVVPGIVNAHNHSNENFFRGQWDNLPLEPWMLFSYPTLSNPPYSEREIYVRTLLGALEMVRSGATCVVDYVYELAGWTDETLGSVVRAYRDLGLRAVIVIGMSDRAYQESVVLDLSLVPDDLMRRLEREKPPPWREWEAFARRAVERYHRPDEGISIALGPSGPQRCTDEMLAGCAQLADELDLTIHIHVLETRMQALSGMKMYGQTLPEHLHELGFLGPRVSFEHGIWLTESDIELVAATRTSITHNPISNMKLGSGIAAIPVLLEHDVNVAMGSDGMSSNDGNDMYATLKVAGLLHKLWDIDYERWLGAPEAWRMATRGGTQAAGDDGLGRIEPGRHADLVLLDLESRVFTPLNNPLHQIVFCSATSAVHSTMVGGRWVLRDGRTAGVDEAEILAEGRELGRAVVERHGEAWALSRRLLASVRGGWLEALATDVGIKRSIPLERR
jgi:cytosine/adenosine deaminase-related metal-dependent hydrolase